jgi:hypothetical protein
MSDRSLMDIYNRSIVPVFISPMQRPFNALGGMLWAASPAAQFANKYYGLEKEIPGILDLASLRGSQKLSVGAMQERNELAEKYSRDTSEFNLQLLEQGKAQESFASRLLEQNERLAGIREGITSSASAASSTRIYSGLAQSQMQNTARYLKELEAYKAPSVPEIDFSFRDPITGKKLEIDTQFEDVYEEGDLPENIARQLVLDRFKKKSEKIKDQFLKESGSSYGSVENYYTNEIKAYADQTGMSLDMAVNELYNMKGSSKYGGSESWFNANATDADRAKQDYFEQFQRAKRMESVAENFSEAQALADIAGFTDFTVGKKQNVKFDAVAAFYEQDINKVLEDMISGTTDRLTIARLGQREDFMREFNRRRERAMDQQEAFNRQQRENRDRAESMAQEKRRVQSLFESQKREYETTMSSFGYTPEAIAGGITFDDTRPM